MPHELVDLSHTIEDGMITYKGLPAPIICDFLSREASREHYTGGTEFHIGKIELVANTGTYVDSPFHRFAGGKSTWYRSARHKCRPGCHGRFVSRTGCQRQSGTRAHGLGTSLGHGPVFRGAHVSDG